MLSLWFKELPLIARLIGGLLTSLIGSVYLTSFIIKHFRWLKKNTVVRESVPPQHLKKNGTPTLGGIAIFLAYTVSLCLWGDLTSPVLWITFAVWVAFAGIGLLDDYYKLSKPDSASGLSARGKYCLQSCFSLLIALVWYYVSTTEPYCIEGVPQFILDMGFIAWIYIVIVGSSNAFNLTDGLDGLAISQVIIIAVGLLVLSYLSMQEISVLYSLLIGSSLGFLWYNAYPAKIFMGDVGALPLGAFLALSSIIQGEPLTFAFMAIIPVIETLSVIIQVLTFKLYKKRFFLMAPLHHHLELSGQSEPLIVQKMAVTALAMMIFCVFVRLNQ